MHYRSMTPAEDGLPIVGQSARLLGLRRGDDVTCDANDLVLSGGMSVAPETPWNLPPHRRPRHLGRASTGNNKDAVYEIGEIDISKEQLTVTQDHEDHALIHGDGPCHFGELVRRIEATRPSWSQWTENRADQ